MANKKNNWNMYLMYAGIAAAAIAGYFIYKKQKDKPDPNKPEPPPPPLPPIPPSPPTPKPKPAQPTSSKPSKAKATELQKLIERRYVQLNRSSELPKNFADGDFGGDSQKAVENIRPQSFKDRGGVTASNVDQWITIFKDDIAKTAKDEQDLKTKQTTQKENIKLASDYIAYVKANKDRRLRLLNDVTASKFEFDAVRNRYIDLKSTTKYSKGRKFSADDLIDRGNGQIGIKSGQFRYFVSASNFITD